jgi:hypothetical protein
MKRLVARARASALATSLASMPFDSSARQLRRRRRRRVVWRAAAVVVLPAHDSSDFSSNPSALARQNDDVDASAPPKCHARRRVGDSPDQRMVSSLSAAKLVSGRTRGDKDRGEDARTTWARRNSCVARVAWTSSRSRFERGRDRGAPGCIDGSSRQHFAQTGEIARAPRADFPCSATRRLRARFRSLSDEGMEPGRLGHRLLIEALASS